MTIKTGSKTQVAVDIEVYSNFFVTVCREIKTDKVREYYLKDANRIRKMLKSAEIVCFNGLNYDIPVLWKIAKGELKTHQNIKKFSDSIIVGGLKWWEHDIKTQIDSTSMIDLINVAPAVHTSLKLYGGRIHAPKMQDLPVEPNATLTEEQKELITRYCHNDVDVTVRLFKQLSGQIQLRRDMSKIYDTDLMSKSDAQIAEAVFKSKLGYVSKPNIDDEMTWRYDAPDWMTNAHLVGDAEFRLSDKRAVKMPKELSNKRINIGNSTYKLGIGGLHSTESKVSHVPSDDEVLRDFDVASYYPSIILQGGWYPEQLGEEFISVYKKVVDERLNAKRMVAKLKRRKVELEKELENAKQNLS